MAAVIKDEDRSITRSCRVTIIILEARDLKKDGSGCYANDPYFKIKVEKVSWKTSQVKSSNNKDGNVHVNQKFTCDVKDAKTAGLCIKVFDKLFFGKVSLGACLELHIAELLDESLDEKEKGAKWYDLYSRKGKKKMNGKVLMEIVAHMAAPEEKINVFVGTWNIGNAKPPDDLSPWLPSNAFYELIAIGAQECDYQPRPQYSDCGKDWFSSLNDHLGARYKALQATSRGQMRMVVFVRDDAMKAITEVYRDSEATGVGHVMANKGGLCIAFKFWDTRICFVNSHFAAHVGQCSARNSNYKEIVGQLRVGVQGMDILNQFHHVFWLGDLNYRLDFGSMEDKSTKPSQESWLKVVKMIDDGNSKDLLQYDELRREIAASKVLYQFNEGEITFVPTFKMERNKLNTYSQKRIPAWCDRILWRSLEGCDVNIISYSSSPEIMTSDHKPVAARFSLQTYSLPSFSPSSSVSYSSQRWHIRFTSLKAKDLRASDIGGSSDPYIIFLGPNLIKEFRTTTKRKTLSPDWDPEKELPTLVLMPSPLQRLEKEYLMVRVFDFDIASGDDSLGSTTIPLAQAVDAFRKGPQEAACFKVNILHHGLPKGTLEGEMKLTCEETFLKRGTTFINRVLKKTISTRNSLKNVLLLKEFSWRTDQL